MLGFHIQHLWWKIRKDYLCGCDVCVYCYPPKACSVFIAIVNTVLILTLNFRKCTALSTRQLFATRDTVEIMGLNF